MRENSDEKQTEIVTVELPKNILELLKATCPNISKYLQSTILEGIKADLDNQTIFIDSLRENYKVA